MIRAAIVAVIIVSLAGCGGGPLSSRQLRDHAQAICAAADARTDHIPSPGLSDAGPFLRGGVTVFERQLAALQRLHPSRPARAVFATALAKLGQEIAAMRRARAAIAGGGDPLTVFPALQRELAPLEASQSRAWRALGIPGCVGD